MGTNNEVKIMAGKEVMDYIMAKCERYSSIILVPALITEVNNDELRYPIILYFFLKYYLLIFEYQDLTRVNRKEDQCPELHMVDLYSVSDPLSSTGDSVRHAYK